MATADGCVDDAADKVSGDGKADAGGVAGLRKNRAVDANELAIHVDERAAAIAAIN